jgi:hypothetical protein
MDDRTSSGWWTGMRSVVVVLVLAVFGESLGLSLEVQENQHQETQVQSLQSEMSAADVRLRRVEESISAVHARHHEPHADIELDRLCVCLLPDATRIVCEPPGEGCVMNGKDWCVAAHVAGTECCSLSDTRDLKHPCAKLLSSAR